MLNRQTDGTSFFGCGTWAVAPPQLSLPDDPNKDFMNSVECFGISLCLAHEDIRKRVLVVVAGNTVACVDVAVEEPSAAAEAADANPGGSEAIEALLGKRLQCVVEANCWEGGAEVLTLTGAPPIVGTPWLNARTRWAKEEGDVEGGAQLVPSGCACYLPNERPRKASKEVDIGRDTDIACGGRRERRSAMRVMSILESGCVEGCEEENSGVKTRISR